MTPAGDVPELLLEELARADEQHARALAELDELAAPTAGIRSDSDRLARFLEEAPTEARRLEAALAEAAADRAQRERAVGEARDQIEAAASGREAEPAAAARRDVVRAEDALALARRRVDAAEAAVAAHRERVADAGREAGAVEARAHALAAALRGVPRVATEAGTAPPPGLTGVSDWASTAGAALFLARGAVGAERDAVIRQANELASAVLGEPIAAASVDVVRRRLEPPA